jgi:hypothetical protein
VGQQRQQLDDVRLQRQYKKNCICVDPARRSEDAERTCGRAHLQFYSKTDDLYFADAYMGLMRVGPAGGVADVVAVKGDGVPFNFTNGVDVDQATGDGYSPARAPATRTHKTRRSF